MPDRKPVQIYVSAEQKSEWEAFVDESNRIDSMASLIRNSVSEYIASDDSSSSDGLNDEAVDELLGAIDSLESDVGRLQDSIKLTRLEMLDDEEVLELVKSGSEEMLEMWLQKQTEELLEELGYGGEY